MMLDKMLINNSEFGNYAEFDPIWKDFVFENEIIQIEILSNLIQTHLELVWKHGDKET